MSIGKDPIEDADPAADAIADKVAARVVDKIADSDRVAGKIADALVDKLADKLFEKLSETRRKPFAKFADSQPEDKKGDGLWSAYLEDALEEDTTDSERWIGFTTGMFAFTGLFAATVAAFVVVSYGLLRPDTNVQTVALLSQLVSASNLSPVVPMPDLSVEVFPVPLKTAVVVNSLWFLALVISLVCALLTALIQEWGSDYLHDIRKPSREMTIKDYALYHIHVRMGIERFGMNNLMSFIVTLMHTAVALFLVGLAMFLYPINHVPSVVVEVAGFATATLYVSFSVVPLFDQSIPSRTPLTHLLIAIEWSISFVLLPAVTLIVLPILSIFDEDHMAWWSYDGISLIGTVLQLMIRSILPVQRYSVNGSLEWTRMLDSMSATPMKARHLIFMWQHSRGYMLVDNHSSILLDYLPRQLLSTSESDARTYRRFFTFLGHNPQIMKRIRHIMSSVKTAEAGVGVLQLLQLFIPTDLRTSRALSSEWDAFRRSRLSPEFPDIIKNLKNVNIAAWAAGDVTLFVELTKFRLSLVELLAKPVPGTLLPSVRVLHLKPLEDMLEAFKVLEGFRLLPLFSNAGTSLTSHTSSYNFETAPGRSVLALLAILIGVQSGEAELQVKPLTDEADGQESSPTTLPVFVGSNGLQPKLYFDKLREIRKGMSSWLWSNWYPVGVQADSLKPQASDIFSFLVDYALINEDIVQEDHEFTVAPYEFSEQSVMKEIIADIITRLAGLIDINSLHDKHARDRGQRQLREEFGIKIGYIKYLTIDQVEEGAEAVGKEHQENERRRMQQMEEWKEAMKRQIEELEPREKAVEKGQAPDDTTDVTNGQPSRVSLQPVEEVELCPGNPGDKGKGVKIIQ